MTLVKKMRRWNCFQGAKLLPCIQWVDLLTLLVRNFGDLYNDADKNGDNNCVQISTCATLLITWWWWNRCYTFFITRAQFVGLRSWTLILWSPVKVVFPTYWYIIFEWSSPILVSSPIDDLYIGFKISSPFNISSLK